MSLIIAVDGPAAAGKGTLARRLAVQFALPYLDTGLLYRGTGRRVLIAGGDLAEVTREIEARDEADRTRSAAPLVPAQDAMLLDTTELDAEAAFAAALEMIKRRLAT